MRLSALVALTGAQLWAQDAFLARWKAVEAQRPPGVTLVVSADKSEFYSGELIPLRLSFAAAPSGGFVADSSSYDRIGRLNVIEEFLVNPAALTEDPLHGLPGETGGAGGISAGNVPLSPQPFIVEKLLNDYVRFRKPGQYRIAVISRRVARAGRPADRVELVSNIVTLTIVPAPARWVQEQIAQAVRILDAPLDTSDQGRRLRLRSGRTLRFLDTPHSAIELASHLGPQVDVDMWSLYTGLLASSYRKQVLPLLEARLIAPDEAVSSLYLDTLSRLSELVASGGRMNSYPSDPALEAAWRNEWSRREAVIQGKRRQYVSRLIASLPAKRPEARAISIETLLESTSQDSGHGAWIPAISAQLIADFRSLPSRMQSYLLESRWALIRSPAMLPVLREIYVHPQEPRVDPPLQDSAARRIYELAPEEGRRILLNEIAAKDSFLKVRTLGMLPDRTLPQLNDVLAARLESGQYADLLILRYSNGDIVERVENAHRKRNEELDRQSLPRCAGPLIFYFLRYDQAFGERELRREMERTAPFPACYDLGFQFLSLDRSVYSPALERLAIEFLGSPKVPVKRGAAELLRKYGSAAAQKPLWDTLEYFHSWWKGREDQLAEPVGQEGVHLERALRLALAQADGWVLQREGLQQLLGLCSSPWCRQEVTGWLSRAEVPVEIRIVPVADGFYAEIAQYETHSVDQLRRKLVQYPAGSIFRVIPLVGSGTPARLEAEQMVRSAGYTLAPQ